MAYQPSEEILDKYANVLVNFALGGEKGIKKDDYIYANMPLSALPLYRAIRKTIFDSGGFMIGGLVDDMDGFGKYFYEHATPEQLKSFPRPYFKGLVDQIDHRLGVLSEYDVHELDKIDKTKIIEVQKSMKPAVALMDKKENQGKLTWTIGLYGTESLAKEAGMSLEEYWKQIIQGCYLDKPNPITEWRKITEETRRVAKKLSGLMIDKVHVEGKDVDLWIKIGQDRKWMAGSGRNIPSFEVFTSPDWRGTEGWIRFNQPNLYYGPRIENIELHFKKGRVAKASASAHQEMLEAMLDADRGARQVGEFSLTDKRLSRITKFMAETLFDENMGGPFGNTHIAIGRSYLETYAKGAAAVTKTLQRKVGYNESNIHVDFISTTDRTVTATVANGKKLVIYKNGQFTV
ncbi:MAG: aminopeptidase [Candidatus Saccharimonadales bacterium]